MFPVYSGPIAAFGVRAYLDYCLTGKIDHVVSQCERSWSL